MANNFLKFYVNSIIYISIANLVLLIPKLIFNNTLTTVLLGIASLFECVTFILSIAILFYIKQNKIDKIHYRLPIFYLIVYTIWVIISIIFAFQGINLYDFYQTPLIIMNTIGSIFYLTIIIYGFYLLKKKPKTFKIKIKEKESKNKNTYGVVSLVLGLVSFIPLIGLLTGIVAIVFGVLSKRNEKTGLATVGIVLGTLGILITIVLYGSLFYFGFVQRGGVYDNLRADLVKGNLQDSVNAIESYKVRYNHYPDNITDLRNISNNPWIYEDSLQSVGLDSNKDITYYYKNMGDYYYLFSRGVDGIPFTKDDVFPDINDTYNLGYRKPSVSN